MSLKQLRYRSTLSYDCSITTEVKVGFTLTLALLPCVPKRKVTGIILKHNSGYILWSTVS